MIDKKEEALNTPSSSCWGKHEVESGKTRGQRYLKVWQCLGGVSVVSMLVSLVYLQYRVLEQNRHYLDLEERLQQLKKSDRWDTDAGDDTGGGRYNRNAHGVALIGDIEKDIFKNAYLTHQRAMRTLDAALKIQKRFRVVDTASHYHPSIQLSLLKKHNGTILSDNVMWTDKTVSSHSTTAEGKYTGIDQFFGFDEHTQAIHIRRSGRFVVYAQLTYSGRLNNNLNVPITNPDCSYSVELADHSINQPSNPKYGLLHVSVTHYRLGRVIHRTVDGRALTAHDTAYTSGVFILKENERISLKSGWGTPCDVKFSEDKVFFGIYLLA